MADINLVNEELLTYFKEEELCELFNVEHMNALSKRGRKHLLEACHNLDYVCDSKEEVKSQLLTIPTLSSFEGYTLAQYIIYYDDGINLLIRSLDEVLANDAHVVS